MLIKPVIKNINLLNMLLLSIAALFALYSLFPLLDIRVKYALPKPKKSAAFTEEKTPETQTPSVAEYTLISEQNLFHPERQIPVEKKAEQLLPKPDFILFGTLITGDISLAYLEDLKAPRNTSGRGKRQVALKKGDSLSGFTLKEIEADKIVMVRGDEKITIPIIDPSHPRDRKEAAVATATPVTQKLPQQTPAAASRDQRNQQVQAARQQQQSQQSQAAPPTDWRSRILPRPKRDKSVATD